MKRTLQLQEIEATNLKIVSEFAVDLLTAKVLMTFFGTLHKMSCRNWALMTLLFIF